MNQNEVKKLSKSSKQISKKTKTVVFTISAILIVLGLLFATGVVNAENVSAEPFTISTYIASGELYVTIGAVNPSLTTGNYQVLVVSQNVIDVYNGTFVGATGDTFSIPAEYPTLLVEIMKSGAIVQQQTIQGTLTTGSGSGGSSGFTAFDAAIVELQFVLTFIAGMLIFERRQQNKDKMPDEYMQSMDAGDMLVTKELFRSPAKTKEQGEDRLRLYMWLKDNGYEIDTRLKQAPKKER
jgi:hypothetical protein